MQFYQFFITICTCDSSKHQSPLEYCVIVFIWPKLVNFAFVKAFESPLYNLIGSLIFLTEHIRPGPY